MATKKASKKAVKKSASKKAVKKSAKKATKKAAKKSVAKKASKKETEMREMKQGKLKSGRSGKKVTNPKQAIAIGLSEARKKGAKVPPAKK
jgi:glucan-binding YG repeat protein